MVSQEVKKIYYARKNVTENIVLGLIIDTFPKVVIFDDNNRTKTINIRKKLNKGKPILFIDAESNTFNESGSNKKIEFLFVNKNGKNIWIDAKQAKKNTNLTDLHNVIDDCSSNNKGKTLFITNGKGFNNFVLERNNNFIKKNGLEGKVKVLPITNFNSDENISWFD